MKEWKKEGKYDGKVDRMETEVGRHVDWKEEINCRRKKWEFV